MAMRFSDNIAQLSTGPTISVIVANQRNTVKKDIFANLLSAKSIFFKEQIALQPIPVEDDDMDENGMFVPDNGASVYDPIHLPIAGPTPDSVAFPVDPAAFLEFHKWLLKDDLKVDDASLLVKTYILAHRFRAEGMRNALLDDVRDFFASHRNTRVNLDSMLTLAKDLPPHDVPHNGKNKLLEFLVWQLTFEIVMRGYEHYENNDVFHKLLNKSGLIVKWHLKALHEMNPSQAAIRAKKARAQKEKARDAAAGALGGRIKMPTDTSDDEDVKEKLAPGGKKKQYVQFKWPENPSEKVGCHFHEHVDSRECSGQIGKEGRRRRMIIIDP